MLIQFFIAFKANLEVQFAPEIQEMGEFKAGPGDEARLSAKIRAFPDADVNWYLKTVPSGEDEEAQTTKIDKDDKAFER